MLADIYNSLTEGFDTADLKHAKALLEELADQALQEEKSRCLNCRDQNPHELKYCDESVAPFKRPYEVDSKFRGQYAAPKVGTS